MFLRIKRLLFSVSFLYLTLTIPFFLILFFPGWFDLSLKFNPRCERVGIIKASKGLNELNEFFRHTKALDMPLWTRKEKSHMKDVRAITDKLFFLMAVMVPVFLLTFSTRAVSKLSMINVLILICITVVLPFFPYFWRNIFHPLLFSNNNWLNTPVDFSYYILPRSFFKYTLAALIFASSIINLIFWGFFRRKKGFTQSKNIF